MSGLIYFPQKKNALVPSLRDLDFMNVLQYFLYFFEDVTPSGYQSMRFMQTEITKDYA